MDRAKQLERRMQDSYERIDQTVAEGADVAAWETFWLDLLHEYESTCDEIRGADKPDHLPAAARAALDTLAAEITS